MGAYATECDILVFLINSRQKSIIKKSTIFRMVVFRSATRLGYYLFPRCLCEKSS